MPRLPLCAFLCLACLATGALAGGLPAGSKPLTAEEVRRDFIGHTWTGGSGPRRIYVTPAEKAAVGGVPVIMYGRFAEYYAPGGSVVGWVERSGFDAYVDGRWRVSGNEVCVSYQVHRVWKKSGFRSTIPARWCYRLFRAPGGLLLGASKTPSGLEGSIGSYSRPTLRPGNSVAARYEAIRKK